MTTAQKAVARIVDCCGPRLNNVTQYLERRGKA
jgi:hypothetical protein